MSATATADAAAPAKPKSKKLLFILIGLVVTGLLAAGGALFILKMNTASHDDSEEDIQAEVSHAKSGTPPVFLPLENMVVNLADAGGTRFTQLGITLQIDSAKTGEDLKVYMPSIRNSILLLISQRSAEEMLQVQGKEKLSQDIIAAISHEMGYSYEDPNAEAPEGKTKRRRAPPNPVQAVLFSSFIVQ
ncbi:flagellar basal body-associated protein FliL [Hydrogenophaga sp.]|uniref:flagellar basal body-associated FliL family protein n=1 Tax=Hydrogenophaga sp. TaxID=1904254 RepID=UPI0035676A66